MPTSTITVSNTSSRRTSGQIQKPFENAQVAPLPPPAETGPPVEEPTPKRPKRTLKLTASQRERKRAIDREAQRSIRLKTKNYIAHLENLVRIMENGGSSTSHGESGEHPRGQVTTEEAGQERIRALLSQLRQSEDEVRRLREMVTGVQRLVAGALNPGEDSATKQLTGPEAYNIQQPAQMATPLQGMVQDHLENSASVYSHSSDSSSPVIELGYQPFDQPRSAEASARNYTPRVAGLRVHSSHHPDRLNGLGRLVPPAPVFEPPTSEPPDPAKDRVEGELFFLSEREVNRVLAGGHQSFANQPLDEDIVVRAVLHGWRDVQDLYLLDRGWQALRSIDQSIFRECGVVERIAILHMMRLKLLHQSNMNPQFLAPLPPFFQRGPTEDVKVLEKMPLIEHFIWPGLRTSLCKNAGRYINNKFSDSFRRSLKFLWPYNVSDVYERDPMTQLYSVMPEFKRREADLRSWTMRKDFFAHASELMGAIPVYEVSLDRTLIPAGQISMQAGLNAGQMSRRMLQKAPAGAMEKQEATESQMESMRAPAHAHTSHHMGGHPAMATTTTTTTDIPVTQIPHAAEVEAWLGDPDLVPQYWNMGSGMDVGFEAVSPQWTTGPRGFGG
ncbi:uncharacterized protein Z520_06153 [Fonsecaea multimorphosa CBS 102226]|uniref:BZIP domain-containing protein n=1 Tax=Fonsecaea multimorphosa CBS 102226 TaxID=1442371 RepID=A0A0D2KMZ9_9EURO|nr:uncharacterized protein Z520_06153 [Fonsecaea multimorphosa CBS 102226]KIX98073.1 hypothetical protein Z520_06153 [Fonsecaea multimorphosa CBS 102226]OAL24157.1 hypothetical protein AYO22_05816 [Fonsecaea multimorphosa]